jgi:hypothetical protein
MHFSQPLLLAALLPIAALAQSCGSACSLYSLAWSDEFSGTSVNTDVWNYRTDAKGESVQLAANVAEGNGELIINLKKQSIDGYS